MTQNNPEERTFTCESCQGVISIPYDLEPTKAPCPYCGDEVLSPPPPESSAEPVVLTPVVEDEVPEVAPTPVSPPPVEPPAETPVAAKPEKGEAAAAKESVSTEGAAAKTNGEAKAGPAKKGTWKRVRKEKKANKEKPAKAKKKPSKVNLKAPSKSEDKEAAKAVVAKAEVTPVRAPDGPSKVGDGFKGETFEEMAKEEKPAPAKLKKKRKLPSQQTQRKVSPLLFLAAGAVVLLLVIGVLVAVNRGNKPAKPAPVADKKIDNKREEVERSRYLKEGWKPSASQVLNAFLAADSSEDKAQYVIGGAGRIEEMNEFYRDRKVVDADTPIEAFNHEDLAMADKERGLFLMRFDRPAQLAMKDFFKPVAPLEVQHRVEQPDPLLASASDPQRFEMGPTRILAFFKEEGNELRLDWDVFVQTKYRLMREFLDNPKPGSSRVFRVRLHEDVPPFSGTDPKEIRYYRCIDPAHDADFVKVGVGAGSTLGEHLAPLNWLGEQKGEIPSRGATLELEWSDEEEPQVYIKRLICWEYLGLGGVLGNLQLSSGADTAMTGPEL